MKKLLILILPVVLFASCAKDLGEYNIDQKNPATVPAGSLFGNALKQMADNQATPSVNSNVLRYWTQQWTSTTYQDEPRYNITTRDIPTNYWQPIYREVLQDLKEAKRLTEADESLAANVKNNRIAVTEIFSVFAWSVLVNTYGDVPYTEALTAVNKPVYDKAQDIYADLFRRLDAAIAMATPGANFGATDLIYGDNTASWIKFAHSLKMKLALTVADVDAATAQAAITASAASAFTSAADNAGFAYQSALPNINPVANNVSPTFTSRQDYVAGKTIIDILNSLNDPRRAVYFTPVNGAYVGGAIGLNNNFALFSHVGDEILEPSREHLFMDYAEVEFILAEASARWGILGSAADHYNKAITASFDYYGVDGAAAYLAQPSVAYATATGTYKQKIGTQKYLALYNRGQDLWTEWRRLDFPVLTPAANALSVIPLRLTYPRAEGNLNKANRDAAATSIGGDAVSTKLFWDIF
jgi:hypothetical protein